MIVFHKIVEGDDSSLMGEMITTEAVDMSGSTILHLEIPPSLSSSATVRATIDLSAPITPLGHY